MAKITLDSVVSGFKAVAKLVSNFDLIEDALNNKVLYRDNPDGEANQMLSDIDMNSKRLTNLPAPSAASDAARYQDILSNVTASSEPVPSQAGNTDRTLSTDGTNLVFKDGDVLAFTQSGSATRRTLGAKLLETVSPEDFGAAGDDSTDDLAAINSALATGRIVVFKPSTTYRVSDIPSFSNSVLIGNNAILHLDTGTYTPTASYTIDSIEGKLTIAGNTETSPPLTGLTYVATTGSAEDWDVTFNLTDTTGLSTGGLLVFTAPVINASEGHFCGAWEIASVSAGVSFTLKLTQDLASMPAMSPLASLAQFATANTLIKPSFATALDLFVVNNGNIEFQDLSILGGYRTDGSGSSNYDAAIQTSSATLTLTNVRINGFLDGTQTYNTFLTTSNVVISNCEDGHRIESNSVYSPDTSTNAYITGCTRGMTVASSVTNDAPDMMGNSVTSILAQRSLVYLGSNQIVNGDSATGLRSSFGSLVSGGAIIQSGSVGVRALSASSVSYGGSLTNCTTAVRAQQGSFINVKGAVITGATTQYTLNEGFVVNSDGDMLSSNFRQLALEDGVSAPTTLAGTTYIYTDSTNGALRVRFGDGADKLLTTGANNTTNTVTTITSTLAFDDEWTTVNYAGTCTLTLPLATSYPGKLLHVKTITANAVVSASSNVVPIDSATAGTAILPATDGAWAVLRSNGTNWEIFQYG